MDVHELDKTAVLPKLTTKWVARAYHHHLSLASTNDTLKDMAVLHEAVAGTVVISDYQSQGKGRLNRSWDIPPSTSILVSLLLRPDWPVEQANWLTMIATVAAVRAVKQVTGLQIALKWPNDLLLEVDGQWGKVGGLLLESTLSAAGQVGTAVIGMGLNVNPTAEQLPAGLAYPATSLRVAAGAPVSRLDILVAWLAEVERLYDVAVAGESPQAAWESYLMTVGAAVSATHSDGHIIEGIATGTNEWGHLLIRDAAGVVHTVAAGDVTLR